MTKKTKYELRYLPEAKQDFNHAKKWYQKRKPGLEKRFGNEVNLVFRNIQSSPEHYEIRYKNVRIAHTKIFPYGIHFVMDKHSREIVVLAILHHKRDF